MEPRLTEAEVLYTDREWHPATVLGWYRLDVAHEQLLTGLWVFWLVHLRLESGEDLWFEYVDAEHPATVAGRVTSSSAQAAC
jgi:hypothetical protein